MFLHADNDDSDQTARMTCVFAGGTSIRYGFSRRGSKLFAMFGLQPFRNRFRMYPHNSNIYIIIYQFILLISIFLLTS